MSDTDITTSEKIIYKNIITSSPYFSKEIRDTYHIEVFFDPICDNIIDIFIHGIGVVYISCIHSHIGEVRVYFGYCDRLSDHIKAKILKLAIDSTLELLKLDRF